MLAERIKAFIERNRGSVLRNAIRQTSVRLWVRFKLWNSLGRLFKPRWPDQWVFMGGCYNSGTTILREMLSAHPEIASLPREGVELTSVFPDLEMNGWQRMSHRNAALADLEGIDPHAMARQAARDWAPWWARGKRIFLEKSIIHGTWMPALEKGFGECRFIGVIRNGMCAAEGIRRRARPSGAAAQSLKQNEYPIEEAAAQWVFSNERLFRDRDKVKHYLEIRYEDFVANPTDVLTRLFRFIGVDETAFEDRGDGMIAIGQRIFTVRNDNPASLARLTDADRSAFLNVAGSTMQTLGYSGKTT